MGTNKSKKIDKSKLLYLISLIGSILLFVIGVLALIPYETGEFAPDLFRYFTTLSNLLMSLVALICIPFYILCLSKKDFVFPKWLQAIKMVATATVSLTFLTVIFFLGPLMGYAFLFNTFQLVTYHAIEPLLAIALFMFVDINIKINWKTSFFTLMPVLAYGIMYLICNLCLIWVNGDGQMTDHYSLIKIPFMFVVLLVGSYFVTLGLWKVNNIFAKRLENSK